MTDEAPDAISLLEDIDRRQNEVLEQLDELNTQVEGLIKRHLPPKREIAPTVQPAEAA